MPAELRNEAGIIGAAVLAHREEKALRKGKKTDDTHNAGK